MLKTKSILLLVLLLLVWFGIPAANAAINSIHGGVSVGANYSSNADRDADDEKSEWELSPLSAFISYTRKFETGSFFAKYAPSLIYNDDSKDFNLDHYFTLAANKNISFSSRLSSNISDTFTYTYNYRDTYYTTTANTGDDQEDEPRLSDKVGSKKLWRNYFSANVAYAIAKNSQLSFGYNNRILDYSDSGSDSDSDEDGYMYHNPWSGISYWINPQWSTSLNYSYTYADFDASENDFDSHQVSSRLNYTHSVKDSTFVGLSYFEKNYDNGRNRGGDDVLTDENNDYYSVTANLGLNHAFTPQTNLSVSAGPSYIKVDQEDDGNDSNTILDYSGTLTSRFERGSWYIGGSGGYDDRAFEGADENLSKYYRFGAGLDYQLRQDISTYLSGSYRNDEYYEELIDNYEEDSYNASTGLTYSFGRWYHLSARYMYSEVNSDLDNEDYTDHRFLIKLGFSRELKRWED